MPAPRRALVLVDVQQEYFAGPLTSSRSTSPVRSRSATRIPPCPCA